MGRGCIYAILFCANAKQESPCNGMVTVQRDWI